MGRTFTEQLTEGQAIDGVNAGPTVLNATNTNTLGMNMSIMRRVRYIFQFASVTAGALLTLSIRASNAQNGTYSDITEPTTNPKLTAVAPVAGQPVSIEIRADQLPAGKNWVQGYAAETATNNVTVDIVGVADCSSYDPGNIEDSVTWNQKVVAQ